MNYFKWLEYFGIHLEYIFFILINHFEEIEINLSDFCEFLYSKSTQTPEIPLLNDFEFSEKDI